MDKDTESIRRFTQNFIKKYSREELRQLLKRLSQGDSGQAIADDFNVSRERIRQWMHTFGVVTRTYEIFPVVLEELNKRGRGGRDPTFVV